MQNVLTLETNKYLIKIDNFEGPLDLLCHLIDKNKMEIDKVNLSEISDQYIEYINKMEELNLEVTSEFLIMASTLIYIKSKSLLPKANEDEEEISEEELDRLLEVPEEVSSIKPKMTMQGFEKLFIENYQSILEYQDIFVRIKTRIGIVNITGFNLRLNDMTSDDVMIEGDIDSIDFEKIGWKEQ